MPSYAITGGRGLGYEFVLQLSANPDNQVFSLVRNQNANPDLVKLAKERPNLHLVQADLEDFDSLKRAAKDVESVTGGSLDVLINNAAYTSDPVFFNGPADFFGKEEQLIESARKGYDINVIGVLLTINSFLPLLRRSSIKKVISISTGATELSLIEKAGLTTSLGYAASKAALNVAIKKYSIALKDEGFVFLLLSPGVVSTGVIPTDPEALKQANELMEKFKAIQPSFQGPITPTESVSKMVDIIETLKPEENGAFISHHRSTTQWL